MGANFDYSQILVLVLAIYCIGRGIMVLFTGKLGEREAARLRNFSENGIRRYKLLSAVMNLVGGVVMVVAAVVRMLNLADISLFRIILLVILAVMVAVYYIIYKSCKNAK